MNKGLLLLLVTLIQSQSDGVQLSGSTHSNEKFNENSQEFQSEDWETTSSPYPSDISKEFPEKSQSIRRSGNAVVMIRSILDNNFMRFGRDTGDEDSVDKFQRTARSGIQTNRPNFLRFDRGMKDNFIRFGRGAQDNFIRFGRGGRNGLMPFGRADSDNFLRFGKSDRESFIRFGKGDQNFMRFGRGRLDWANAKKKRMKTYERHANLRQPTRESSDDFERFGEFRPPDAMTHSLTSNGNQRNDSSFLRFLRQRGDNNDEDNDEEDGKGETRTDAEPDADEDMNLDLVIRLKRETSESKNGTEGGKEGENAGDDRHAGKTTEVGHRISRSNTWRNVDGYFERIPEYFPPDTSRFQTVKSWNGYESPAVVRNYNRLTPPFFPISSLNF